MKRYEILAPEIGSKVYSVVYSRMRKRFLDLHIVELTVTNWSYDYRHGLTINGYIPGEYGSYQVRGADTFENKVDAEELLEKMKKLNN